MLLRKSYALLIVKNQQKKRFTICALPAAQSGQLQCLELLVTKHNANPYHVKRGTNINRGINLPPLHWYYKEKYNHSAIYYAVLNGDIEMLKHLLRQATDEELALLFRNESREDLVLLAGANGHCEIISALNKPGSVDNKLIVNALSRAQFYNLIRKGKRQEAEELVDIAAAMREVPDRDGSTLLMYAAFHGFETIVRSLLVSRRRLITPHHTISR